MISVFVFCLNKQPTSSKPRWFYK